MDDPELNSTWLIIFPEPLLYPDISGELAVVLQVNELPGIVDISKIFVLSPEHMIDESGVVVSWGIEYTITVIPVLDILMQLFIRLTASA